VSEPPQPVTVWGPSFKITHQVLGPVAKYSLLHDDVIFGIGRRGGRGGNRGWVAILCP